MQGHILAHFIHKKDESGPEPRFPFLCLIVSGGHTQIVRVDCHLDMHVIGQTRDDAAGEAFDKSAKILGLPYPGGPLIDKHASKGNPERFRFPVPNIDGLDFSFSGLKTAILYFINDNVARDKDFITNNLDDVCASIQHSIIHILMLKIRKAIEQTGIREVAISGGVSANSGLRSAILSLKESEGYNVYIPPFEYCTDNAAMIAVTGYYKYLSKLFTTQDITPLARMDY
jgi:N6-L-threonylcarbamoyladenine synthase